MEEIIITLLILGAGYYFLNHQKNEEKPISHSTSTQTKPTNPDNSEEQKALQSTLDTLIKNIRQLNHQLN